jgi:uncharacterized protein (TIGR00725 family)
MAAAISPLTIGVIGSGTYEHEALATPVGRLLAQLGVNLLTGGGGGVMTSVSRAFVEAPRETGVCIGIIPCRSEADRARAKEGYPNRFVELPIYTHLPHSGPLGREDLSRNHINVLSSAAIVALPGEAGTSSEVSLALEYHKPVIAYASDAGLVAHFARSVERTGDLSRVRAFLGSICDAAQKSSSGAAWLAGRKRCGPDGRWREL